MLKALKQNVNWFSAFFFKCVSLITFVTEEDLKPASKFCETFLADFFNKSD